MVYILGAVAILEFVYIVYQDWQNRAEREKLQLKLMSKDTQEYKKATEKPPKETEPEPDPYKTLDEVSIDKLMQAEDNL